MRQIFRRKDQSIALTELLAYLRDEDSVIPQIPAFFHQGCVVAIVDVEHHSGALQCGKDVLMHVRVRELEDRTVRFIRCPVVKDYILGSGKVYLFPAVNTDILCFHIALIQTAEIKQSSQGEIGALGTVVLIKVQGLVDKERFVIPHPEIDHIVSAFTSRLSGFV